MAGISIPILSNVRDFLSGTKQVEGALDDVADSLDDVARDAARGTDRISDSLSDTGRDVDRLERKFRDLATGTRDSSRKAGDSVRTIKDDIDTVGDASREVGDELRQNLGETFSSFRGDLEDLPQIAQDTLGGLAGSGALGGIPGLAVTAAGAAGLGLIIGAIDNINQAAEKSEERANDLANAYIEAGSTVLSTIETAARVGNVITDKELRTEAENLAKTLSIDMAEAVRIVAGDTNALAGAQAILADRQEKVNEKMHTGKELTAQQIIDIQEEAGAVYDQSAALDVYAQRQDTATQRAKLHSDALKSMIDDYSDVGVEVDEVGNKVVNLPDGTKIFIDANTQQASTNLDRFKGDYDGKIDQMNGRQVVVQSKFDSAGAQSAFDAFIARNNGKAIKVGTRVASIDGEWR